ncbi:MAG: DEAD/DEAH box helicase [Deltaproteobacteria bacterium]|nr:DEAD/DEAH box helicase [Deltaproteobacteria bacterium]
MCAIARKSVADFLARDLETWDWLKEVPGEALTETLLEIHPGAKFKLEPFHHQLASLLIAYSNNSFLYLLDMGGGKTKIVLDALEYRYSQGKVKKTLIVVPNVVTIASWEEEIPKHSDFTYTPLVGNAKEKWELLRNEETDLYIINYSGYQSMVTELVPVPKKKKRKKMPIPALVKEFTSYFGAMVLDEIHLCKNKESLTFKICNALSRQTIFRYGLTGTPFGRDPADLWAQCYLIDRGATLGSTLGMFREAFFDMKKNYWGGFDYKLKKGMYRELHTMLKNVSIRYEENEMNDLPPKIYDTIKLRMSVEAREFYNSAMQGFIDARGNLLELEANFIKLRQIVSGFLKFKDEEGEDQVIKFKHNPKLDTLIDLINATPPDAKVVVFNEYTISGDDIQMRLHKAKIKHVRLYSGTKDKIGTIDKFKKDPKYKVAIINTKSGGSSLNLQVANYVIYYESPVSPIDREQSEKRCHRTGQEKKVFYYDFVMKGSVDAKVMEYLKEGKDLSKALLEGSEVLSVKDN